MFNEWDNPEAIQNIINKSKSRGDVLENMGYGRNNSTQLKKIRNAIDRFELDLSSFTIKTYRWDNLEEIVRESISYAEVLRKVGLADRGGNGLTAKKHIKRLSLDTSHFVGGGNGGTKGMPSSNKKSVKEILCENSSVNKRTVRNVILENDLLEYKCVECGIKDEWNGKPITLQLDHINGISNDNRIENLRFLCPNCHTQTPTWGAKKRN